MTSHMPAHASRASVITTVAAVVALILLGVASPASAAGSSGTPTLEQGIGMQGAPSVRVRTLQRALERRGYDVGRPGADGRFGPLTAKAVRRLQKAHGLKANGIVRRSTRRTLGLTLPAAKPKAAATTKHKAATTKHKAAATKHKAAATKDKAAATKDKAAATKHKAAATTHKAAATKQQPKAVGKPAASLVTNPPPAQPAAAPTTPIARLDSQRSFGEIVATVVFWVVIASLSLLGAIAAWRWARRRRSGGRVVVPAQPTAATERVIGYVSMSPGTTPADHDRSAEAIIAACREADRELVDIVCDAADGRPLERPGLTHALGRIAEGQARGLVMSDMRIFSRSKRELAALVEWFRAADATLVALDLDFDTSTPEGRQVATALLALDGEETDRVSREADAPSEPRINGRRPVRERPQRLGERVMRERLETKG
jgi:hypothetical protein